MREVVCSENIKNYFDKLSSTVKKLHNLAQSAREKGIDPEPKVDTPLAASVAQRVEALIASIIPEIAGTGIAQRISELEQEYGPGDWRVALKIADELSKNKFYEFSEDIKAIETAIRAGLAYITQGVVAAPLEGLVEAKLRLRNDGKKYLALYYAGPIRGAGGTAQAVSIIIADYIRRLKGIAAYDPTEEEVKRYQTEVLDYATRVAKKQYLPEPEEVEFLIKHIPLEITGDPTERLEVSQYKRLPRVETTRIRGGMCLVLTEGPALKAKKVWRTLQKWAKDFGLEEWIWLNGFIKLKDKIRAKETAEEEADIKVKPDYYYLSDMVAGRPVFSYPMRPGGFRLRYGRTRLTGHGSWAISPLTMRVLKNYIATGTQLRVEHPGKSTALTVCNSIDGPIIKLKDGSVIKIESEQQANEIKNKIDEILFLGDLLISYGDFFEQGFRLMPAGWCEEWWVAELKEAAKQKLGSDDISKIAVTLGLQEQFIKGLLKNPIKTKLSIKDAENISKIFSIPLHPHWTYYWKYISNEQKEQLRNEIKSVEKDLPLKAEIKEILELIGCPHTIEEGKIKITEEIFYALKLSLGLTNSEIKIADKAGSTIGARMGRPEKAKLRKMKGSPHVLFPVGMEGGRLRSFQEALTRGYVTADWPIFECPKCNKQTIYPVCESCGEKTISWRICPICKKKTRKAKCHTNTRVYERKRTNIKHYWGSALKAIKMSSPPALIKGVRGTSNKDHYPEHLAKGLLRAKYKLHVNKDGTIRYDTTELPATHFKPKEIRTSIKKLKELGYTKDIKGVPLQSEDQVLEIFPQDVILPSCPDAPEEGADKILHKVSKFVDEELEHLYNLTPFYNLTSPSDLVGHIVIGLAPHTSAGIAGRIIGFSKTQAVFAHPYWHDACRRDCDGEEMAILLALDAFLNFSRQYLPDSRGTRSMDAPLVLTTILNPEEIDDEVYDVDTAWSYPLEFYRATLEYKWPWEFPIEQIKNRIGKCEQYEGIGYTHEVDDMNAGVLFSAYKALPAMIEKLEGQIDLAAKIRAVDLATVAGLVIDKHFIRDIKGNLRKFTRQEFRCTTCNKKYRRTPMAGVCTCGGKLVFTIAEGTVKKYLGASMKLVGYKGVPEYMQQTMSLLKRRIDSIFGEEKTKQTSLLALLPQNKINTTKEL